MWAVIGIMLVLILLVTSPRAEALPSRMCRRLVERTVSAQANDPNRQCEPAICGTLTDGASATTFSSRLSESCAVEMAQYRTVAANGEWLIKRIDGRQQDWRELSKCANGASAMQATNPVVINVRNLEPFMMCSVPKVACTNIRKLLQAILAKPGAPYNPNPDAQMRLAHFGSFPTLWHYRRAHAQVTDTFPSFIIGRSPCAAAPHAAALSAVLVDPPCICIAARLDSAHLLDTQTHACACCVILTPRPRLTRSHLSRNVPPSVAGTCARCPPFWTRWSTTPSSTRTATTGTPWATSTRSSAGARARTTPRTRKTLRSSYTSSRRGRATSPTSTSTCGYRCARRAVPSCCKHPGAGIKLVVCALRCASFQGAPALCIAPARPAGPRRL